jgi:Na+/citrate or Na+/malate symporter
MRQLKGGKTKENAREKRERKKEFIEMKDKAFTIALPILGVIFAVVVVLVFMATRPKQMLD